MPRPERGAQRRLSVVVGTVSVLAAAGILATYTPLFAARQIRVVGSRTIARGELLAIASLDERSNVFHLDVAAVERRLERDPRILDAVVTTSLPDAIRIVVTPREAVAVTGDPPTLVGADGVVIGPALGIPTDPFPEIRGGDVATAAAAAAAMSARLRAAVDEIVVRPDVGIVVQLEGGLSADFGDASELARKAASLAALLAWASREGVRIESADVSVPGSPTATLENGGSIAPPP